MIFTSQNNGERDQASNIMFKWGHISLKWRSFCRSVLFIYSFSFLGEEWSLVLTFIWRWQPCRRIIHKRPTYILSARISLAAFVKTRLDSFLSRCVLERARIKAYRGNKTLPWGQRYLSNKRCRSSTLVLLFSREGLRYAPARIVLFARVANGNAERERR